VKLDNLDHVVCLVQLGLLANVDLEAFEDPPDPLGLLENQDHLVAEECLALMDRLDPRDRVETVEFLDHLVPKESLVMLADLVNQVFRDYEVLLEGVDQEDQGESWEELENPGPMVRMGKQDHKVYKDFLEQWEHQVTRVQLGNKVKREILECLEHLDLGATLEKMVFLDIEELWDLLGPPEIVDLLDLQDQEVFKDCLVLLERMECLEKMGKLDFKVFPE